MHCIDYGNEKEVGQGFQKAIGDGLVKREDLFIVSKLWGTFAEFDRVEPIARKQLADLQIDYFDLYYIHFPVALRYVDPEVRYPPGWNYSGKDGDVQPIKAPLSKTWEAFEILVQKGLAKSIGISNFSGALILELLRTANIVPQVLQIEHHPYLTQPTLLQLAKEQGIVVTAYSSFGPTSFVELNWDSAKNTPKLFEHPVITEIATAHNRTPAQVLLRWATQRGLAVIPKSNDHKRLIQNLDSVGFDLKDEELQKISALNQNLRFNNPSDVSFSLLHLPLHFPGAMADMHLVPEHPAHLRISAYCTTRSEGVTTGLSLERLWHFGILYLWYTTFNMFASWSASLLLPL